MLSRILSGLNHSHPLLYFWDTKERDLAKVVDFIYNGQDEVYHSDLNEFLKISGRLGITGISQNSSKTEENDLIMIETKKQTFEKENYQTGEVPQGRKIWRR